MKMFLESNPGLKSRTDYEIFFPNYSKEQLAEIFGKLAKKKDILVTDEVNEAVLKHLSKNETGGANGNGRYVRKLFERMYASMAARASNVEFKVELLTKFEVDDVPEAIYDFRSQNRIGF
jgi:hypothetical protein